MTFCIVTKRYVLAKNCLKEWIGNQGQKVDFFGSPPYFYFQFRRYGHQDSRFCFIFARTDKQSVLDGRNGLSSSKPCAYFRIVRSSVSSVCLSILLGLSLLWQLCVLSLLILKKWMNEYKLQTFEHSTLEVILIFSARERRMPTL